MLLAGREQMRKSISRRSFLGLSQVVRPPWALDEDRFVDVCTRCGDCVAACPEQILITSRGGYPAVDFGRGGCTFCSRCVQVCDAEALQILDHEAPAWPHEVEHGEACIARHGVECRVCGEICEAEAIRF